MSKNHMTSIGGQAVLEGVMMKGPSKSALSVRKSDGTIALEVENNNSLVSKLKLTKIPIIRGIVAFIDSMISGVRYTMKSAEYVDLEESEPSKFDRFIEKIFGEKLMNFVLWLSVIIAFALGIALFFVVPIYASAFLQGFFTNKYFSLFPQSFVSVVTPYIGGTAFLTISESIIKLAVFLLYMYLVSKMKDMQRVFMYHGAEHKSIACYEAGKELTVENARECTRFHPRCGTSFLLIVIVVSIIVFFFIPEFDKRIYRVIVKLCLLPIVAGISYEIIKFAGRSKSVCARILTKPGLALQRLTTREPEDDMLEVAINSLKAVLPSEGEDDNW